MKKSVVAITQVPSGSCQTAASSAVSVPTKSCGNSAPVWPARSCCSTAGASLQPQPPPCASSVRRSVGAHAVGRGVAASAGRGVATTSGRGIATTSGRGIAMPVGRGIATTSAGTWSICAPPRDRGLRADAAWTPRRAQRRTGASHRTWRGRWDATRWECNCCGAAGRRHRPRSLRSDRNSCGEPDRRRGRSGDQRRRRRVDRRHVQAAGGKPRRSAIEQVGLTIAPASLSCLSPPSAAGSKPRTAGIRLPRPRRRAGCPPRSPAA